MLNLDETSLARMAFNIKGHVVTSQTPGGVLRQEITQRAPTRQRRGTVTHVAVIAERSDVQPALPQVFLGNGQRFSRTLETQLQQDAPANVHIWRESSSWNTIETMIRIIDLLGVALQPWLATFQPILLLDMAFCHLGSRVTERAAQAGIWLLPVPTGLTWLAQPLDTHCFAAYKRRWRRAFERVRQTAENGVVTDIAWGHLLFDNVTRYLNAKRWRQSFDETGTLGSQASLGPRFLSALRPLTPAQIVAVPPGVPTIAELKALFPSNRRHDIVEYFRPVLEAAQGVGA